MIHRYIIEVTDEVKGFEKAIERLDREWGIEELEPYEDAISREAVIQIIANKLNPCTDMFKCLEMSEIKEDVENLPSVTPKFTDTEIQKMQELEQAQLDKAYELGKAEMQPCEDCISRTELLSRIDAERKHLLELKMDGAEHIIVHHARRIIEDMPSVAGSED